MSEEAKASSTPPLSEEAKTSALHASSTPPLSEEAKTCPWCDRWALKDNACDYIFACGLETVGKFHIGAGCGRSWCWKCGKKYCGQYYDPVTGQRLPTAKDNHDVNCCKSEPGFKEEDFCPGGHNPHCARRW